MLALDKIDAFNLIPRSQRFILPVKWLPFYKSPEEIKLHIVEAHDLVAH